MRQGNNFAGGEFQIGGTYDITDNGTQYMVTNVPVGTGLLAYTPALAFGGASTGITYTTQSANVMTLGNWVWVWILIVLVEQRVVNGSCQGQPAGEGEQRRGRDRTDPDGIDSVRQCHVYGVPAISPYPNTALANLLVTTTGVAQTALTDTAFTNTSTIACQVLYPGVP